MRARSGSPAARRAAAAFAAAVGDRSARPDYRWIARLTGASPDSVADVVAEAEALVPMETAIRRAHRATGRVGGFAQIRAPLELYAITRLQRPDAVVEVGVSSGVSSAHFLAALRRNRHGRLHSIDRPTFQRGPRLARNESPVSIPPGRSSGWAVPSRLRTRWDLRLGPSQRLLPRVIRELPPIGIFLHDDLHTPAHLAWELRTVRPRLAPAAVVLADNSRWTGRAFPRFAEREGVRWTARRGTDLWGLRLAA